MHNPQKPEIYMLMVSSVDGIISVDGEKQIENSAEDKKHFAEFTKDAGCVIMGTKTFFSMPSPLVDRMNVVLTRDVDKYQKTQSLYSNVTFLDSSDLLAVLQWIQNHGYHNAVLAGGPTINTLFLQQHLVDYLSLTIEPKIVGTGLKIVSDKLNIDLELLETIHLNKNTLLLQYKVINQPI